jgi:hypothetical protein
MRILFDQGTPVPLRQALTGHVVETAFDRGWSELQNGELLESAEAAGFEIFVTTDQRLRYQQDLSLRKIAILVLTTTSWPRIQPHAKSVVAAIEDLKSGGYRELSFPK